MKQESLYMTTVQDNDFLGYYTPVDIPIEDDTNQIITITEKYNHKPGKLALDLFGTPRLSWVFRYFNNDKIEDPIFDLKTGISIVVPTKERLIRYIG